MVLVTEDVEAAISKAVAAGAVNEGEEVTDGAERVVKLKDPYGFVWAVSSIPKDPPPAPPTVDVEA